MAGYADCLAGFIERLGLERPHVAGLSFGGALALELSRRHPAIPRTLTLASAYAGWAGSLSADVVEQRLRQALALADLPPDEFVGALLPTMLVYGDSDVRAPLTVAEDLHAAIPGSALAVLPDVGHACSVEAPDAFNGAVRAFLRGARG
jgi:pimeloyl-ACP methyl ester carboxylesterase